MQDVINLVLAIVIVAAFWWAGPRSGEHFRAVAAASPDLSDEDRPPAD